MAFYQVWQIAKSFGDTEILKDIRFQLSDRERVGLVGNNGSGKTTLLRILAGLEEPDRGIISVPKRAAVEMMQQPDLDGDRLSGGERTWLALNRLLADPPDLMLLDEPTNNLDLQNTRAAIKLLHQCSGSMIIVSHDRYFLDSMVTRILEIEDGRIVEYDGNYSYYRQEKLRLYDERLHRYQEDRKEQKRVREAIRQTRQWAEKAHRDSTKADSSGNTKGTKEYHRSKAMKMEKTISGG
jgi:macrolide transport system ATP-binding/permease protein